MDDPAPSPSTRQVSARVPSFRRGYSIIDRVADPYSGMASSERLSGQANTWMPSAIKMAGTPHHLIGSVPVLNSDALGLLSANAHAEVMTAHLIELLGISSGLSFGYLERGGELVGSYSAGPLSEHLPFSQRPRRSGLEGLNSLNMDGANFGRLLALGFITQSGQDAYPIDFSRVYPPGLVLPDAAERIQNAPQMEDPAQQRSDTRNRFIETLERFYDVEPDAIAQPWGGVANLPAWVSLALFAEQQARLRRAAHSQRW